MLGVFVAGWIKRGPSGIIGTNIVDAQVKMQYSSVSDSVTWENL